MLRPSFSIHTAFMRFAIDVVFLDHDQTVIRIDPGLRPFHTASCRGAREVVELAAGECARRGLEVGDRIAWAPRGVFDEGPDEGRRRSSAVTSRGIRPHRLLRPAVREARAVPPAAARTSR